MSLTNNKRRRPPSTDSSGGGGTPAPRGTETQTIHTDTPWKSAPEPAGLISWHDHFMNVAKEAARRSKDPKCRVGAALVSQDNRLLAEGYNCMPHGRDDLFPWEDKEQKLRFVCHAELNCIVSAARQGVPEGCRMYVTRVPCGNCAKLLVQSGVKQVIYYERKHAQDAEQMYDRLQRDDDEFQLHIAIQRGNAASVLGTLPTGIDMDQLSYL